MNLHKKKKTCAYTFWMGYLHPIMFYSKLLARVNWDIIIAWLSSNMTSALILFRGKVRQGKDIFLYIVVNRPCCTTLVTIFKWDLKRRTNSDPKWRTNIWFWLGPKLLLLRYYTTTFQDSEYTTEYISLIYKQSGIQWLSIDLGDNSSLKLW